MVPFSKKNTLEQTEFKLMDEGFSHRGISYKFDEILETAIFRQRHELRTIGVGSDFTHSIGILFVMDSGENVQLTEQPTWLSNSKLDRVEKVQNIFNIISEETFNNRANMYLKQVEEQGFFEYSGWDFYPEKKKIIYRNKKRAYPIHTTNFLRSYGFIKVVNKADSFGDKIRNKFKGDIGISTIRNTDVFFALLKHFFNLEWK